MGVHGLTTYLRENKRGLTSTVAFNAPATEPDVPVVVDGWSFIYELQYHPLFEASWVYGGEYAEFARVVSQVVRMWVAVGLQVHFVFDGPYPPAKFDTLTLRAAQNCIQPAQIFFRTSAASRATQRSLRENRILPPFMYAAVLTALGALADADPDGVHVHHADEEGDPFAVDLAARLGAFVLGHDSDYVVLNADGYRGYVPLDELLWTWSVPPPPPADGAALSPSPAEEDGWFEPVRKGKRKNTQQPQADASRRSALGLLPPELDISGSSVPSELSLSFTVYHPGRLAAQLSLPVSLLPLLGALVGNDYTPQVASATARGFHHLFFARSLTLPQRITHVSKILRDITTPAPSIARKPPAPAKGVMAIIEAAVTKLLNRDISLIGAGERERIVDTVAEATLQYALAPPEALNPSRFCPLHECDACPLVTTLTDGTEEEDVMQAEIRRRFVGAYRTGQLSPRLVDAVSSTTAWPRLFLESPDAEATARALGRPLRQWTYAVMDEAVGLPEPAPDARSAGAESDDDDALIDVVEDHSDDEDDAATRPITPSDPLAAALAAKLQRLLERRAFHSGVVSPASTTRPGSAAGFSTTFSVSQLSGLTGALRGSKVVSEHLRRGTRLAEEEVPVRSFAALQDMHAWPAEWQGDRAATPDVPLVLRDEAERLQVFLRIVGADGARLGSLPSPQIAPVAAVRYVVRQLALRAQEKGSKESEKDKWTKKDARALLSAFDWQASCDGHALVNGVANEPSASEVSDIVIVENRNVQIVAQFFAALEAIHHLAQSLLLATRVPNPMHLFSGRRCHAKLMSSSSASVPSAVWDACAHGMDEHFALERSKKAKKVATPPQMSPSPSFRSGTNTKQTSASMYALLSGMTVS